MLIAWVVVHFVQVVGALAAVAFFVLGIRRYVRARARFRSKPWCLRCRYACHDLPDPRCPECGRAVASRLDLPRWCRWDGWTSLMLAAALVAAIAAARNPRIERLYHMLPDRTIAEAQVTEGRLAAPLLSEFDRRLVRRNGADLASLTVSIWLRRTHAISPIARAQRIEDSSQVRVGFRKLGPAPNAVVRANDLVRHYVQINEAGVTDPWLRAELRELIAVTAFLSIAHESMACDLPIRIANAGLEVTIEPVFNTATPLLAPIGDISSIGRRKPPELSHKEEGTPIELEIHTSPLMDAPGYAASVRGTPAGNPGSHAFDVVFPMSDGREYRLQFLGWEWLSGGVLSFVEDQAEASSIHVIIR